jgi:hypothetical protein
MACLLLACFALQDWHRHGPPRFGPPRFGPPRFGPIAIAGALVMLLLARALRLAWNEVVPLARSDHLHAVYLLAALAAALAALLMVALGLRLRPTRSSRVWLGGALVVYAAAVFALPLLSGTRKLPLDRGLVAFLHSHLGWSRCFTLGPLQPNWGAAFGIASINYGALPVPSDWVRYIRQHLDPGADSISLSGNYPVPVAGAESRAAALTRRLDAYRAIGVKYIVSDAGHSPFAAPPDVRVGDPDAPDSTMSLGPDDHLMGELAAGRLASGDVSRIDVDLGPGAAAAGGTLTIEICGWRTCGSGIGAVGSATGQSLPVTLSPALRINLGEPATFRITRPAGEAPLRLRLRPLSPADASLAVGTRSGPLPGQTPGLLLHFAAPPSPPLVYTSRLAEVYELPDPAPYVEARGAACSLQQSDRQTVAADCPAPALLVRRKLADPGWRARVNGAAVPVIRTDEIFQSVALPAGHSDIRFRYAPPYLGLTVAAALVGLAALGGGLWRARPGQNRTERASEPT